ncbi:hypothetical protein MHYP_G00127120 [Metynnis hypsauchen]
MLVCEKALDDDGVSREAYTAFGRSFWSTVKERRNECLDSDQTIQRKNGKLLLDCGLKDTWTMALFQSDCHQCLS